MKFVFINARVPTVRHPWIIIMKSSYDSSLIGAVTNISTYNVTLKNKITYTKCE